MKTDFEIQHDVMAELLWEPALKANEIGVSVNKGVVVLSGIVDNFYKKMMAEKAAKKVEGVRAVAEEIEVKIAGKGKRTDVDIAIALLDALKWNSSVDETKLKVSVEKGIVTLEGIVEWNFQKVSAFKAIENLKGVAGIINNIKVSNRLSDQKVKEKISQAFLRNASIDSERINIQTVGDTVILSGTVRSLHEKRDAERTVWSSPAVLHVDNRLEVDPEIPGK